MARKTTKRGKASTKRTASTFHPDPSVRIKRVGGKEYNLSKYVQVKSAEGNTSLNCGDATAKKLAGRDLDDVYKLAAKELGIPERDLRSRYKHLNVGMQRMNLGNRLRAA